MTPVTNLRHLLAPLTFITQASCVLSPHKLLSDGDHKLRFSLPRSAQLLQCRYGGVEAKGWRHVGVATCDSNVGSFKYSLTSLSGDADRKYFLLTFFGFGTQATMNTLTTFPRVVLNLARLSARSIQQARNAEVLSIHPRFGASSFGMRLYIRRILDSSSRMKFRRNLCFHPHRKARTRQLATEAAQAKIDYEAKYAEKLKQKAQK